MISHFFAKKLNLSTGIPGLKIKNQKTINFEGSLPSFFLKSITLGKKGV